MVLLLKYRTYYSDCRFKTLDTLRLLYNMAPSKRSTGPSLQATAGSLCRWPAQGESCSACGSGLSTEKDCDKGKPAWSAVSSYCPTSEAFRSRYYPWLLGDSCQVNWDYRATESRPGRLGGPVKSLESVWISGEAQCGVTPVVAGCLYTVRAIFVVVRFFCWLVVVAI